MEQVEPQDPEGRPCDCRLLCREVVSDAAVARGTKHPDAYKLPVGVFCREAASEYRAGLANEGS